MSATASKAAQKAGTAALKQGARRDPELYILGGVMAGAFGLAGYYFGRKPTSSSSEEKVAIKEGSMPWQKEAAPGDDARALYKYQYHPHGDPRNPPKDAPSALNTVVVPDVKLPKELHEKFNKWGKEGF